MQAVYRELFGKKRSIICSFKRASDGLWLDARRVKDESEFANVRLITHNGVHKWTASVLRMCARGFCLLIPPSSPISSPASVGMGIVSPPPHPEMSTATTLQMIL